MYPDAPLSHIIERHKKPMLMKEVPEESKHYWAGCLGPAVPVPCGLWALSRRKKEL